MASTITLNHVECLRELLKSGARVNLNEALYFAASHGQDKCMEVLIEAGADVNVNLKIREPDTPLQVAAKRGFAESVKVLIQAGADVNRHGHSALVAAATHGNVECCDLLIKPGIDVNISYHHGYTPLMSAVEGIYVPENHRENCGSLCAPTLTKKCPDQQDQWTRLECLNWSPYVFTAYHAAQQNDVYFITCCWREDR